MLGGTGFCNFTIVTLMAFEPDDPAAVAGGTVPKNRDRVP
jgi:hypothetical protein